MIKSYEKPTGLMTLPKMDEVEIRPGIRLIGEPTPIPGTNKLSCLANVFGALCLVELSIKFAAAQEKSEVSQ